MFNSKRLKVLLLNIYQNLLAYIITILVRIICTDKSILPLQAFVRRPSVEIMYCLYRGNPMFDNTFPSSNTQNMDRLEEESN